MRRSVALVLLLAALQGGGAGDVSSPRVKRAPFDFGEFVKKASEQIVEAAKNVKTEDLKKTWEDVKQHVGAAGHALQEHVDKARHGEYDDQAKQVLHDVGDRAQQLASGLDNLDLERTKEDAGKNWQNIKAGAEQLGQNVQKATKIDLATPGKAFVDILQKSVSHAYEASEGNASCALPAAPQFGFLEAAGEDLVHYYCHSGYQLAGAATSVCREGRWEGEPPVCRRYCAVTPHVSVQYRCRTAGGEPRDCLAAEELQTELSARCNAPNYQSKAALPDVTCGHRGWSGRLPVCLPVCGLVTPRGFPLVAGGRVAERGEVPWHAGVYRRTAAVPQHICGATILTDTVLISAAHCFWNDVEGLMSASHFYIAAGKLYKPWNSVRDSDAQKREVSDIYAPKRFRGVETNFQDDLALLRLREPLSYRPHVRPVCLDLSARLNNLQLVPGGVGKVAGWGLAGAEGGSSPALRVADMPYVDVLRCLEAAPFSFREYITSDKFCAGHTNGTALCRGDSGGGLAFPDRSEGFPRYFLRGVVSTAPRADGDAACNTHAYTAFTEVVRHAAFVDMHVHT